MDYWSLALFFVLLVFSIIFSAAEVSLLMADKIKLLEMANAGVAIAEKILKLRSKREQILTAILITNNLVNIAATIIFNQIAQNMGMHSEWLIVLVMTVIIVIFGEMLPKQGASRKPIAMAKFSYYIIVGMTFILYPFVWLFTQITNGILWIFRISPPGDSSKVTDSELEAMIEVSHQEGLIPTEERVMIEKVFDFADTTVYEVMVPRVDMLSAPITASLTDLTKLIISSGHSRIPVYKDNSDNIVGILHVKDLIPLITSRKKELTFQQFLREPYFIPESKHISEVFKDMRARRIHLAVVVDEYGGVSGLVTLEDLLEELVGEIQDEYDTEEDQVKIIDEKTYVLAGDMMTEELNELLGTEISSEDFETVAGFMVAQLGHLGKTGEKVEYEGFTFVVDKIKKLRILKVKVINNQSDDTDKED
jgi:putative hemolysin